MFKQLAFLYHGDMHTKTLRCRSGDDAVNHQYTADKYVVSQRNGCTPQACRPVHRKTAGAGGGTRRTPGWRAISLLLVLVVSLPPIQQADIAGAQEPGDEPADAAMQDRTLPGRLARQVAPKPGKFWHPGDLSRYTDRLASIERSPIDPDKTYSLVDLIDLAEKTNPETRVAWEGARQAAIRLGLVESEYFPVLTLSAIGGYTSEVVPVSQTLAPSGFYRVELARIAPDLDLRWLLLDFGRRETARNSAKERLLASNLSFNRRHQEIIWGVQQSFYSLTSLLAKTAVAQSAVESARAVRESAEAHLRNGLATISDVSLARQQEAQAAFDLEDVLAMERDAQVALAESIGISPTTPVRVTDFSALPPPAALEDSVDKVIDRALTNRPDLIAKVALLRAKEKEVRRARAEYYPTLSMASDVNMLGGRARITDTRGINGSFSASEPGYGVGLALEWKIFEGGATRKRIQLAEAERRAAEDEVTSVRDRTIREVWKAYTDIRLAVRRLDVADALVDASLKSYDTTLASYRGGLSTLIDLLTARRELTRARFVEVDTRLQLLNASAALAFTAGLTNPGQQPGKMK